MIGVELHLDRPFPEEPLRDPPTEVLADAPGDAPDQAGDGGADHAG
jgi:hypothetical protein